jgi:type II secretory pathway component PulJ
MTKRRSARAAGFTTMEALVASTLTIIMALAILGFFDAQQRAYATLSTYAESQTVTRTAVDLIGREIRMASYDPLTTALALSPGPTCPNEDEGLVVGMSNRIRIQQDLTANGVIDAAGEDVTYAQSGNRIVRTDNVTNSIAVLVENVDANGFVVRYFDGSTPPVEAVPAGTPAALTQDQRACVEKVQLEIHSRIDDPYPTRPDLHSVVRSMVAIRNRSLGKF